MCVCLCVCVCICQSTFRQRARPPLTRIPTNTHTHTHTLPCCCILAENGLQEAQAAWVRRVLHIVLGGGGGGGGSRGGSGGGGGVIASGGRVPEEEEAYQTGAGRLHLRRRGDPLGSLEPLQDMGKTCTRNIHQAAEYLSQDTTQHGYFPPCSQRGMQSIFDEI